MNNLTPTEQLIVDHCQWVIDQTNAQRDLLKDSEAAAKLVNLLR